MKQEQGTGSKEEDEGPKDQATIRAQRSLNPSAAKAPGFAPAGSCSPVTLSGEGKIFMPRRAQCAQPLTIRMRTRRVPGVESRRPGGHMSNGRQH